VLPDRHGAARAGLGDEDRRVVSLLVVLDQVDEAGAVLLDRIVAHTRQRTFSHVFADATFRLAELGTDAGVVGAARVAIIGVRTAYA